MGRLIDLTGRKIGCWTVLAIHPERMRYGKAGQAVLALWLCRCDCGTERLVFGCNLHRGLSLCCGCIGREKTRKRSTKHGHARRGNISRAYWCWQHLKGRCLNPNDKAYCWYGGREQPELPITVCEKWQHSFENFFADMLDPPPGLSIDRIDNDGNYEPGNCQWASASVQRANQRPRKKRKRRRADVAEIRAYGAALARAQQRDTTS
jgi:hypothetical protein